MFDTRTRQLTADNVKALLEEKNSLLVDVLPPEHYQRRHIPGAFNACVYEIDFLNQMEMICADTSRRIILYGAGPASFDSRVAAEKLIQDNYTDVMIFPGGLQEWLDADNALEGENPETPILPHPALILDKPFFTIVPEESRVTWVGRNAMNRHTGTVNVFSGNILGSTDMLHGEIVLDMASIADQDLAGDELQPVLEGHLKSDDFFFTTLFPKAKLTITSMIPIPGRAATQYTYNVTGTLSMQGMHKDITFDAHLHNLEKNELAIMAHFDLDRTRWGIIYGSARFFEHLSYHLVYDLISIEARIVLA
ncbi:MAG: YceI family protein [Desulfoplanes sp.]|nr:YceI family protein [Desulfoplanes sp.]